VFLVFSEHVLLVFLDHVVLVFLDHVVLVFLDHVVLVLSSVRRDPDDNSIVKVYLTTGSHRCHQCNGAAEGGALVG
jgi:hypothetical protein